MEENKGTGKKGKMLVCADLVTPTGFSRVAHSLIKYWESYYDIVGIGVNYHGDPHEYKFPIFPAHNGISLYGENRLVELLNMNDFDIVWILNDAWVINKYLKAIKENVTTTLPKIIVYFPVDATEHNPEWYSNFGIISAAVTYTKFGQWVVRDANPILDVKVIPHGVDTSKFFQITEKRSDFKNKFFEPYLEKSGDMSNSFIVLNANRNQPRKKIDIAIRGFAKFARNKPKNVKFYSHCGIIDASVDVNALANRYGITDRLIVSSTKKGVQVAPDWRLNEIYNVADVGINTSMGEGWGLPNVEHAVTGAVQLVPSHSACRELFMDYGILMNTCSDFMFDNSMTIGRLVSPDEVANKLEFLYKNPEERERLAKLGYEKFTAPEFSWKEISKTWLELFSEVTNASSVP